MSHLIDTSKCETGITDRYKKKFEGVGRNRQEANASRIKYTKNYAAMKGFCKKCDKYDPEAKRTGSGCEHCKLPENEQCQK